MHMCLEPKMNNNDYEGSLHEVKLHNCLPSYLSGLLVNMKNPLTESQLIEGGDISCPSTKIANCA